MIACSRCGTIAAPSAGTEAGAQPDSAEPERADTVPAGWSFETGARGIQWLCLACTRENVRSIEAKLPEEWW